MNLVLDTFPLIRLFKAEAGSERVKEILLKIQHSKGLLFMSEINAGEMYYTLARKTSLERAEEILASLSIIPVNLIPTSWELTLSAAKIKAQHSLSFADCFAVAVAIEQKATLLTGDPEFKQVEDLVKIQWI